MLFLILRVLIARGQNHQLLHLTSRHPAKIQGYLSELFASLPNQGPILGLITHWQIRSLQCQDVTFWSWTLLSSFPGCEELSGTDDLPPWSRDQPADFLLREEECQHSGLMTLCTIGTCCWQHSELCHNANFISSLLMRKKLHTHACCHWIESGCTGNFLVLVRSSFFSLYLTLCCCLVGRNQFLRISLSLMVLFIVNSISWMTWCSHVSLRELPVNFFKKTFSYFIFASSKINCDLISVHFFVFPLKCVLVLYYLSVSWIESQITSGVSWWGSVVMGEDIFHTHHEEVGGMRPQKALWCVPQQRNQGKRPTLPQWLSNEGWVLKINVL